MNITSVIHPIKPIYNKDSKILILGSFPSVKSREQEFFYGHPQNRFWRVLSAVFDESVPVTNEEKTAFLLNHNIALWDVIHSCDIVGSSDSSIKNVVPNDISRIIEESNIVQIFTNGKKSDQLYQKHILHISEFESICLPSTSPANATWSLDKLVTKWGEEIHKFI